MLSAPSRVRQLAGLGNTGDVEGRRGENFWGNNVEQIGGRHVRVISILTSPDRRPHLYESDVANAVAEAGLVVRTVPAMTTFFPGCSALPAIGAASSSASRGSWPLPGRT
jgi:hypothetical protein